MTLLQYSEGGEGKEFAESGGCIDDYISRGDIHLVLMFSNQFSERILVNYAIRRLAVDFGVPLITNIQVAEVKNLRKKYDYLRSQLDDDSDAEHTPESEASDESDASESELVPTKKN